jgi:hypothetical protein
VNEHNTTIPKPLTWLNEMSKLLKIEAIELTTDRQQDPERESLPDNFKAYTIESTAGNKIGHEISCSSTPSEEIRKIVDFIAESLDKGNTAAVEIVVKIHGYNTGTKKFMEDSQVACAELADIQNTANKSPSPKKTIVFLNYHWPSEDISPTALLKRLPGAWHLLPVWLKWYLLPLATLGSIQVLPRVFPKVELPPLLIGTISTGVAWYFLPKWLKGYLLPLALAILGSIEVLPRVFPKVPDTLNRLPPWLIWTIFLIFLALASLTLMVSITVVIMRLTGYFQDSYRAIHYGVLDLVQFFRTFQALAKDNSKLAKYFPSNEEKTSSHQRIGLSFVAHSMGAFVTTNLVRILSDVFDPGDNSLVIDTIDGTNVHSDRKPDIGQCFALNRLVLVSPDIPVNAILDNRSNFLSSSLARFEESYLFSNEGDMVLLLFSTVANYISFPSTVDQMGYKLGNIGIKTNNGIDDVDKYRESYFSIIKPGEDPNQTGNILENLLIGVDRKNLLEAGYSLGREIELERKHDPNLREEVSDPENPFLAQRITYFDCTDYLRQRIRNKAEFKGLKPMKWQDYGSLIVPPSRIGQSHGAYFDRSFSASRKAIYTIVSQGFDYFKETDNGKDIRNGLSGIKILRANEFEEPKDPQNS